MAQLAGFAPDGDQANHRLTRARDHDLLTNLGQVGYQGLVVFLEDLRAHGDFHDHCWAFAAGPIATHSVHAGAGLEMLLVAVIDQRVQAIDASGDDVAAASAVAPVRAAELDEFLAAKRDGAGAAVARANVDFGLVEEFHNECLSGRRPSGNANRGLYGSKAAVSATLSAMRCAPGRRR